MVFSGSKIGTAWSTIKTEIGSSGLVPEWIEPIADDVNHILTYTDNVPSTTIGDDFIMGIQINQSGTKIKMGNQIYTKQ
jgi:hypothetical protein